LLELTSPGKEAGKGDRPLFPMAGIPSTTPAKRYCTEAGCAMA